MKNQGKASSRQACSSGIAKKTLLSAMLAGAFAVSAQAATTEAWVATSSQAHDPRAAVHIGPLKAGEQVRIVVSLKLRNKDALDTLTAKLMSGAKGVQPLTAEQFKSAHAPTDAQVADVVKYLREQGFTQIEVAPNNLLVSATGGAGLVKSAFQAELHEYDVNGRRAYANVTAALVPAHLGGSVLGVLGLQTVHLAHVNAKRLAAPDAATPQTVTGVTISNFPAIYGASSLPSATTATIGIITSGSLTQTITDLKSFASTAGYPAPPVTTSVIGTPSTDTSGTDEWNLDSQSSLAAAGGTIKSMILYNVADLSDASLTLGYNKAVTDKLAKVVNVSLGGCESDEGSSESSEDQIFQAAVAQGTTFSVSSGDSGAYECGATAGKAQSYPAVSPYVMAIGGTSLSTTGGNTWAGETVWACSSASSCQQSSSGGAGGGPSLTENAPSWQTAAGVLGTSTKRGVPDVSFDADPNSGAMVLINGTLTQIGGTSLAAPLFTGFFSRIQSAHGLTAPFPASTLYAGAAANPSWFHDVTSGNQGYAAGTGWDYASGYGSLQVANFSAAFGSTGGGGTTTPTANFTDTTSGLTATFTDASSDVGGTINAYAWTFGDGGTSTVKSPTHTYTAAGTYTVTETVKDTGGASATKSASVTVAAAGGGATNVVTNGGFETSAAPWTLSSGVYCTNATCSGETAHSGTGFAWLDGYGATHTDTASQSITIPAGKTSATLTFYLHIDTAETTKTAANDKLTVAVTSGSTTTTLGTFSNLNAATGYVLQTFNLSAFIGKTVTLTFTGTENSSKQTSFVLDDVAVNVQ
jgi:xanthomonalisin